MPELPEVETIANRLKFGTEFYPSLLGFKVKSAAVYWPRALSEPGLDIFTTRICNQEILDVGRRAKYLVIKLSNQVLLFHLRMSGDIRVESGSLSNPPTTHTHNQKHDRISIGFSNGWQLVFNDPRKFGRVWLVSNPDTLFHKLGPEPFDPNLTSEKFYQLLKSRKRQIKPLLLDQSFLAGLGNIYSDEVLFQAGIHPESISCNLSLQETSGLLEAIHFVLREAIQSNGASIDWVYRGGSYQNRFRVYHHTGKPCSRCGSLILHKTIGQRSAHFCPVCQIHK